jgi:hypothetical protein
LRLFRSIRRRSTRRKEPHFAAHAVQISPHLEWNGSSGNDPLARASVVNAASCSPPCSNATAESFRVRRIRSASDTGERAHEHIVRERALTRRADPKLFLSPCAVLFGRVADQADCGSTIADVTLRERRAHWRDQRESQADFEGEVHCSLHRRRP